MGAWNALLATSDFQLMRTRVSEPFYGLLLLMKFMMNGREFGYGKISVVVMIRFGIFQV